MFNIYRDEKSDENRLNVTAARSMYKIFIRKCRFEYDQLQTVNLREDKLKNAKLYWKMLKSCAGISNNNIPSDTFKQG